MKRVLPTRRLEYGVGLLIEQTASSNESVYGRMDTDMPGWDRGRIKSYPDVMFEASIDEDTN